MKKYKWDLYELKLYYEAMQEAYEVNDDEDVKYSINSMIEMYRMMLNIFNKRKGFKEFDDNLESCSLDDLIDETLDFYTYDKLDIINAVIQAFKVVRKYDITDDLTDDKIAITNEQIVSVTKDFFKKMTPIYIEEKFDKIINSHNVLNISYSKSNSDYAGITVIDPLLKKKYIHINRTNHLSDLIILPHEAFHYIFLSDKAGIIDSYNSLFLSEVEGCLANTLFGEYYKNNATENNNFFIDYYKFVFKDEIAELFIRHALIDSLKENKSIRLNKINKVMSYYGGTPFENRDKIKEYLEMPQEVNMKYAISFLVAIDLYNIYKYDQDKCFYLLKNIKYHIKEDNILRLLRNNEITFMDDGYKNLEKYLKK